jgi:hypothetical protein
LVIGLVASAGQAGEGHGEHRDASWGWNSHGSL